MKRIGAAIAVAAVVLAVAIAIVGGGVSAQTALSPANLAAATCPLSGQVRGLDAEQAANADLIVAAAMAGSGDNRDAAKVALMVALTESDLRNLDHGDADSVGLFQQRPSQGWGTPVQLVEPTYATEAFVTRLVAVPAWTALPPWIAAETVQGSGFPDGSNYQPNWAPAGRILAAVLVDANQPGECEQGSGVPAGPPGAYGLPAGYTVPVVAFAVTQLGKPYVWGAAGPGSYDCSGLTMAAWGTVGVTLEHYTGDQQQEGVAVTASQLEAGDLVLVPGSDSPGPGIAGHVGLYLGDGLVLSAIDPASGVAVQTWGAFTAGGVDALRDPAPAL
jgi:cell wall-associated NlpC family hydrolase